MLALGKSFPGMSCLVECKQEKFKKSVLHPNKTQGLQKCLKSVFREKVDHI